MDEETKTLLLWLIPTGMLVFFLFRIFLCSSIGLKPYVTKHPAKDKNIERTKDTGAWAERNGFELLDFYVVRYGMLQFFMATWESIEKPVYLCQYSFGTGSGTVDFTSIFDNEIELTTVNSKDANAYPKPLWDYHQSFSKCGFNELYQMHIEGEEYLITKGWAKRAKLPIDFEQCFLNSMKKQKCYGRKHWYRIFFILYFYFFRRYKWHNKTIQQQHERGMIQLPNEIHPEQLYR